MFFNVRPIESSSGVSCRHCGKPIKEHSIYDKMIIDINTLRRTYGGRMGFKKVVAVLCPGDLPKHCEEYKE